MPAEQICRPLTEAPASSERVIPSDPRRLCVLLVDDHVESVEPLARLLEMDGHEAHSAFNADDALDDARRFRFDLLVSDLDMPVTDGCELLRRVRRLYPVRATAITAHTGDTFTRQAKAAGYERLLIKPLRFDELLEAVNGCPSRPGSGPSGDAPPAELQ